MANISLMKSERKDAIVCIRIPRSLKTEMNKLDINWSEYLRGVIESKVRMEKIKKTWKEIEKIRESLTL
ncbi:hypothetical protein Arcpr_1369 [Archaeoglobus profundus DSM 5631]|uniref:VapB-type antitoxin n=2 Tax=Archaeoglobus profundus TaxID=84156 RepID=D2RE74_ARCPA|nr:hypothetical protein Arcpr_1369 [Archaeoglobus profundus DSM 5631]